VQTFGGKKIVAVSGSSNRRAHYRSTPALTRRVMARNVKPFLDMRNPIFKALVHCIEIGDVTYVMKEDEPSFYLTEKGAKKKVSQ